MSHQQTIISRVRWVCKLRGEGQRADDTLAELSRAARPTGLHHKPVTWACPLPEASTPHPTASKCPHWAAALKAKWQNTVTGYHKYPRDSSPLRKSVLQAFSTLPISLCNSLYIPYLSCPRDTFKPQMYCTAVHVLWPFGGPQATVIAKIFVPICLLCLLWGNVSQLKIHEFAWTQILVLFLKFI